MTVVRDQFFPQKPPGSRFRFSRTGVQPSPGSSTIELPSAFAESGAYPPDREPPGSPRQCSLPLACRHPPEGHQIGARKRRTPENTILSQPYCRRVSTDRSDREGSQLAASLEGEPGPTPAGKTLPHSYPETRFRRERARDRHTSRDHAGGRSHRVSSPSFCGACLNFFLARRIQPFLSLVDRQAIFCILTNQSFSTCWTCLFFFGGKIPVRVTAPRFELTSQRQKVVISQLPTEPPRRPCETL